MSDLYVFAQTDGLWLPYGGGPGPAIPSAALDPFVTMVTEPTALNCGPGLGGFRALDYNLDRIDQNVTLQAGDVLANKVINGWVNGPVTAELVNCDVRGMATPPAATSSQHRPLVKTIDHVPTVGGPRLRLTHCKVEPQTKSQYWDTCLGYYGWETNRCLLQGTTDIVASRSNASGNGLANCLALDTYMGPMVQWDPDLVQPRSTTYKGTHNDTWQLEGNTGGADDVRARNVTFHARMMLNAGQPSASRTYWTETVSIAAIVASPNTKDRVGFSAEHCFFYGGAYNCINLGGQTNPQLWSIRVLDSKFERPGAPGVPAGYPVKAFVLSSTVPRDATTIARNYFMDNGAVVPVNAG